MVILNYANITYYWFSIITKYDVQFLTIHLKWHTHFTLP